MDAVDDGSLVQPHRPARRAAKSSDLMGWLLLALTIFTIAGAVVFTLMGQTTIALTIGILGAAIVAGSVC